MLSHLYNTVNNCGIVSPGHGKYILDSLNANNQRFITILMTIVKLHCADTNNSQMIMNTSMIITDISIARVFQKYITDSTRSHGLIDHGKYRTRASKRKWM